jgi:hypothetical protein
VAQGVGPEFKPQYYKTKPKNFLSRCQWFMPIILATWEAEIGRIVVPGQPRQII